MDERILALCVGGGPWDGRYLQVPGHVRGVAVPPVSENATPVTEESAMSTTAPVTYSYEYIGRKRWDTPNRCVWLFGWTGPKDDGDG